VDVPEVERRTPSQDGSQKLVLRYGDGARVQAVLMPDADRLTLCVSTQVAAASDAPSATPARWGSSAT